MNFPDPPIFAKEYTAEAVKEGTCPPPPPIPKNFRAFGEEYDLDSILVPSLTSMGLNQVYTECNTMEEYKAELKKLNNSLIVAFLDILELLTRDPLSDARHEQFETLKMLFVNMHHVINELRVVQARTALASIQQEQNRQLQVVSKNLDTAQVEAEKFVEETSELGKEFIIKEEEFAKEEEDLKKWVYK